MIETVLITGATGFLGRHLTSELVRSGKYRVICYKRYTSEIEKLPSNVVSNIEWVDIANLDQPFKSNNKIDHIIHLATCYGRSGESLSSQLKVNILLPIRLLELAIRYNSKTFINTDTLLPFNLSEYARSKAQLYDWLKIISSKKHSLKIINIKIEHMYGPGDDETKFIPFVITKCLKNEDTLLTDGMQQRDFIYIDDVVLAITHLMRNSGLFDQKLSDFQLGTGRPIRVKDAVKLIHKITKSKSKLKFGAVPKRHGELEISVANVDKLLIMGWEPKFNFEEGLKKTLECEGIY